MNDASQKQTREAEDLEALKKKLPFTHSTPIGDLGSHLTPAVVLVCQLFPSFKSKLMN